MEESLGDQTLHDRAVASLDGGRTLPDDVTDTAAHVAARLLRAQAAHLVRPTPGTLRQWLNSAGFTQNVFQENPDLDNARTHAALDHALDHLGTVPLVRGHLEVRCRSSCASRRRGSGRSPRR
ncbi:hypothetical protein ACFFTL_41070, partial [Streptomyces yanii]